jgi:hypothetical protein
MRIRVFNFPGNAARGRERYYRVQIEPDGSPLRHQFSYVLVQDDEGDRELVCVESGIVQPVDDLADLDPDNLPLVTAAVVRDFEETWERYERAASASLASVLDVDATPRPRERRVLSDEFLADIVERHRDAERQGVPGTKALAHQERVGTSTVRGWLRQARQRGIGETS